MNTKSIEIIPLIMSFFFLMPLYAQAQGPSISDAHQHLQNQEYESARDLYQELADEGYQGTSLFYNLGICYYELEDYPRAILNFEKALKIDVHHKAARHNLRLANQKIEQEFIPIQDFFLKRWWTGFYQALPLNGWALLSLVLMILLVVSFFFMLFPSGNISHSLAKKVFYPVLFVLLIAVISGLQKRHVMTSVQSAIVLEEIPLYEGPDERSPEKHRLKAGTRLRLQDQIGPWLKVELVNKEQGWVNPSTGQLGNI